MLARIRALGPPGVVAGGACYAVAAERRQHVAIHQAADLGRDHAGVAEHGSLGRQGQGTLRARAGRVVIAAAGQPQARGGIFEGGRLWGKVAVCVTGS